ncbi:MAG: tripartite tricarboxylate transporter substrate binding protein [Pseudomonadota bacterium]|nr:tripartite tricarboxylate transporter substrate binding protein [Pseudomonadota bacterium]
MNFRRRLLAATLTATTLSTLGFALPSTALAQSAAWPTRPVKLIVGFPGGSTPDIAARVLADSLARELGQPVIIENKPGASGNLAADQVAKATDDHTLGVVINGNLTTSKLLNSKLPFDPGTDFTLLSLIATAPLVLVTPANLPEGKAFIAAAQKAGNEWNYGSVGVGSVGHLGMALIQSRVPGMAAVHVPYNGNPAVVGALISGQIQMALMPPGIALPQVKAGKLHAVGLAGGRSVLAPDVAPLADLGVKMPPLEVWVALVGPANLSKAAQARLAATVPKLVRGGEVRQRLFNAGWQAQGSLPEVLRARVKSEVALLGGIIQSQHITIQ